MGRRRIPANITDEYRETLRCRDFMGELTEAEIPIAKKLGVYGWDETVKGWRKEERGRRA
jgi:hypothetical protein